MAISPTIRVLVKWRFLTCLCQVHNPVYSSNGSHRRTGGDSMPRIFIFSLVVCSIAFAQITKGSSGSLEDIAIVGGTLIDVRNGQEIPDTVVLVNGDRITQVGTREKLQIPRGANVIDARGKWILPGLMDMHAHVSNEDSDALPLELYLANGVTT